jgi:hypothetical protein
MPFPTSKTPYIPSDQTGTFSIPQERVQPFSVEHSKENMFAVVSQIGSKIADISIHFKELKRINELANARTSANVLLEDAVSNFENPDFLKDNPNPDKFVELYANLSSDVYGAIAKKLSSSRAKKEFSSEFEQLKQNHSLRVRQIARTNQIDSAKSDLLARISINEKAIIQHEKNGNFDAVSNLLASVESDIMAHGGILYPKEEALSLSQKFAQRVQTNIWNQRIINNPEISYQTLKDGPVSGLDENERIRLIKAVEPAAIAETHKRRNETVLEYLQASFADSPEKAINFLNSSDNRKKNGLSIEDSQYLKKIIIAQQSYKKKQATQKKRKLKLFEEQIELGVMKGIADGTFDPASLSSMGLSQNRKELWLDIYNSDLQISDKATFNAFMQTATSKDFDPEDLKQQIGKSITALDAMAIFEHYKLHGIRGGDNEYSNQLLKNATDLAEAQIKEGSILTGFDEDSEENFYLFQNALIQVLREGEKSGLTYVDMLDPMSKKYIIKTLIERFKSTTTSSSEKIRSFREKQERDYSDIIQKGTKGIIQDPNTRKPGETIDEFLIRTQDK